MIKVITTEDFALRETVKKTVEKANESPTPKKIYLDVMDSRGKIEAEELLKDSFNDIFGIWLCGALRRAKQKQWRAATDQGKHVPGIHEADFYGIPCTAYVWIAQGYPRGIVLAKEDSADLHALAKEIMDKNPWNPAPISNMGLGEESLVAAIKEAMARARFSLPGSGGKTNTPAAAPAGKPSDAGATIIRFGKYSGLSLQEIKDRDFDYLKWLAESSNRPDIREAATKLAA